MRTYLFAVALALCFCACDGEPDITDDLLDGTAISDPSVLDPSSRLLSYSSPTPSPSDAAKPVFIAVHGYSATTFEWDEFRTWSATQSNYHLSQVLLGGHGRTYADFKAARWEDWQDSIIEEYDRLVAAGYSNINFVASSTGGTLLLDLLAREFFDGKVVPRNILMVDPVVVSSDKFLSLAHIVGPSIGFIEADNTTEEDQYWYHYRPQETLQELLTLTTHVRKQLEDGITIPEGCRVKVYKSVKDPTADPVSAVMIYKGMKYADGSQIDLDMIDSRLHVYTRLDLRTAVTEQDFKNQSETFADFVVRATNASGLR